MNRLRILAALAVAAATIASLGIYFSRKAIADGVQSRSDSRTVSSDQLVADLRTIGATVVKATLEADVETLLRYDRGSVSAAEREELRKRMGFLHCFLFDASCNFKKSPSVRDTLAGTRELQIDVEILKSTTPPAGLLLFYDGRLVDKRRLNSSTYRCELDARHELRSWLFIREKDGWVAANPPFDAETDTLCSPP